MTIAMTAVTIAVTVLTFFLANSVVKQVVPVRAFIKPYMQSMAVFVCFALFCIISYYTTPFGGYIFIYIVIFAYISIVYSTRFLSALCITNFVYFVFTIPHLLMVNIFTLATYTSSMALIADQLLYTTSCLCSMLLSLTITAVVKVFFDGRSFYALVNSRPQLIQYTTIQVVLNVFCVALCYSFYVEIQNVLFYAYNIVTIGVMSIITIVLGTFSLKASRYYSIELKNQIFEEQLQRQLLHYESYRVYTESLQAFKHDYNKMMTTVQTLLGENKYTEAKRLIDQIDERMQTQVKMHVRYCNNNVLDAILYDVANKCQSAGIKFSCTLYLDKNIVLPELETCTIFSNILDNAIDASLKLEESQRFISVTSTHKHNWTSFTIKNSFDGSILIKENKIFTSKAESALHGFGLKNMNAAIESVGGFVEILPDAPNKVFTIVAHFPTSEKV